MIVPGGPMFWVLLVMGLVSLFIFFERFVELRRAKIDWQDFLKGVINVLDQGNVEEALSICEDIDVPVANVVATAIRNRTATARVLREAVDSQGRAETGRLDRRLAALAIIGQIAPLVGLLGTIFGFIQLVKVLGSAELVSRAELTNTLAQTFLTAAMGLVVAIPVMVMYGVLRTRLDRLVLELEAAASRILAYISTAKETLNASTTREVSA